MAVLRQIKTNLIRNTRCFSSGTIFSSSGFDYKDPLGLESQLTEEEKLVRDSARAFAEENLLPIVVEAARNETFDRKLMTEFGKYGLLGATVGAGVNYVSYGLIAREIERVDSGFRSAMSVQSSLVISPINQFGTDDQKKRLLPGLISGELIGCFGLTEPDYGSDPGGMKTTAVRIPGTDNYSLSGSKTWITNSPLADVLLIWAKCVENESDDRTKAPIRGFIIERNKVTGLDTPKISNKLSLRASTTGSIFMDKVEISGDNVLPEPFNLSGPFFCLNNARYGISWGVMGAAEDCYLRARDYVMNRKQFGKELARNQIVQYKLAEMMTEISLGLQASLQVGRTFDKAKEDSNFKVCPESISLIKRNNCIKALDISRKCRDMMGGNGITEEYHVMRHLTNLETVNTYEGTQDIHALILGRGITGFQAFVAK